MITWDFFIKEAQVFVEKVSNELISTGIFSFVIRADHLCFRVSTAEQYAMMKDFLQKHQATKISEANINGRPIATYRLIESLSTALGEISLIELPSPKMGHPFPDGFEHVELVTNVSFSELSSRFSQLKWKETTHRSLNQEICLVLPFGQVKFHYCGLDRIIEIEESKITDIVFDLDGTLVMAHDQIEKINQKIFSRLLARDVPLSEVREKLAPTFKELASNFGMTKEKEILDVVGAWGAFSQEMSFEFFPGIKDLLMHLLEKKYRLHLWTSRDEISGKKILRDNAVDGIWTSESYFHPNYSKPNKASFQFLKKMTASASTSLMVGDSTADMMAAKEIGAIVGAAFWDPSAKLERLIEAGAEVFFKHPREVLEFLAILSPHV